MTAAVTGVADDYLDMIDRLATFLSTDSNLVGAGQEWEIMEYDGAIVGTELYLRGQGLDGQANIFVGLRAYENSSLDWFNIACRGYVGYLETATWDTHPGAGPERGVTAWDQPITYWFVADGRRFIAGYRVSTVDQILHGGLLTPYATPLQYPLPLMVAGTMTSAAEIRWSSEASTHNFFTHGASQDLRPLRFVDGQYLDDLDTWPDSLGMPFRETYGDHYPILPIVFSRDGGQAVMGEVEGLFQIPGFAQASGNTFTIESEDYVVLQNVFRTADNDYLALRLS